jgi:hypothetical protein
LYYFCATIVLVQTRVGSEVPCFLSVVPQAVPTPHFSRAANNYAGPGVPNLLAIPNYLIPTRASYRHGNSSAYRWCGGRYGHDDDGGYQGEGSGQGVVVGLRGAGGRADFCTIKVDLYRELEKGSREW